MKTQRRTNEKPARFAQVIAFVLPFLFLLPFLSQISGETAQVYTGLNLLSNNPALIRVIPMFVFACAALLLGVVYLFNGRKSFLYALVAAFSGAVIAGIYALLTAKQTSDATGVLAAPFMVSDLNITFWLFLLLSICGLTASLMAVRNPATYIILTGMAIIWLLPILWLVITSFRAEPGAYTTYILPKGYTLSNYSRLFTETTQFNFPRWYMNTLIVAVFTCVITTMLVLMISFTFSRLRFSSRKLYMNVGLILSMFPGFMSMIAVYHILKAVGLDKTLASLILVYSGGGALGYFIAKGFFDTIPRSLDEAATIDGASKNMIFWKIILPSSTPIIVYTAIIAFIAPWVDFIFVSVIMKDNYQNYTIALGLFRMLEREFIYDYFTRFCAGAVLVAVPITLLFIKIQRFYVEGVTGGAVKG